MKALVTLILVALATPAGATELRPSKWLPDRQLTPGAVNAAISQSNIDQTICNHGHWSTKSIRPPVSYTNKLKRKQIEQYQYEATDPHLYEEDHLIPLTLGGDPRSPNNLWPQPWDGAWGAHAKDKLEVKLNRMVCEGTLTLKQAQMAIARDWIAAYRKYVAKKTAR